MADEKTEEAKQSGGSKGIIIILIVLIVILLAALGGGGYYLYSQGAFSQDKTEAKDEQPEVAETFRAKIEDLVLNITNSKGREKLMKLSFSIKSTEPTIAGLIEENKAEIIDTVIAQISARSSEELLTVGGKNLLKEELKDDINALINEAVKSNSDIKQNSIEKIFFTSFVIK